MLEKIIILRKRISKPSKFEKKVFELIKKIFKIPYLFIGLISFIFSQKKVIFMIDGGLGSQMWQYAIGQAIEIKSGMPVYYDLTFYKHGGKDLTGLFNRNWALEKTFQSVIVKKASCCDVLFYKKFFNKKYSINGNGRVDSFIDEILTSKKSRYLGEYYRSVKYLDFIEKRLHELYVFDTTEFSEKTINLSRKIRKSVCAIAIHVRRGDFINCGIETPLDYFYIAIDKIKGFITAQKQDPLKIEFYVFSDNIPFCQNVFSNRNEKFIFADMNDNDSVSQDIYLISQCQHFITSAASNVGWWGAFLSSVNDDKIVIAPKDKGYSCKLPNDWIVL